MILRIFIILFFIPSIALGAQNIGYKYGILHDLELSTNDGRVAEISVIYEGDPQILTEETNVFKAWYIHHTGTWANLASAEILYAESADGYNWTRYSGNPVIGAYNNSYWYFSSFVCKIDGTYYLTVRGGTKAGSFAGLKLQLFSSSDGITWTQLDADMLPKGEAGTWDATYFGNSCLLKEGSTYFFFYNGYGSTTERWWDGFATSTDLSTWTKDTNNPISVDSDPPLSFAGPNIFKIGNKYYNFANSQPEFLPGQIAISESSDKINWSQVGSTYFLPRELDWEGVGNDAGQTADMHVVEVNGWTYFFYSGYNGQEAVCARIGLAVIRDTLDNICTNHATDGTLWLSATWPSETFNMSIADTIAVNDTGTPARLSTGGRCFYGNTIIHRALAQ